MSEDEDEADPEAGEAGPGTDDPDADGSTGGTGEGGPAVSEPQDASAPDEELVERVADADPEELAAELVALRERGADAEAALADCQAEVEDLEARLKRKQADFENYKKRMEKRREEEAHRATQDLLERLLDVRDNLLRALEQDEDADVRSGVETTLTQFDDVLAAEDVRSIEPGHGDEVDPRRHEVLMRVESGQEPGTVVEVHRPGYEMAGQVLRPAQVTVAEEPDD